MPELPEVESLQRELAKAITGKKIAEAVIYSPRVIREPSVAVFKKQISGAVIRRVVRRAKLLVIELSNGKALTIHLKMTGQLLYPGSKKEARVSFRFSDESTLDFCDRRLFGEVRLVDDWRSLAFVKRLGPEPFELDQDRFKQMLRYRKTKIKPLLMDQSFISGVGNLYAAEALFRARIHPARPAQSLTDKEASLLFKELTRTLTAAIEHKGSSVDQYVRLSGKPGGYVKYHKVYDRAGKPCFTCGTPIQRSSLGGRGTYFCPRCQK